MKRLQKLKEREEYIAIYGSLRKGMYNYQSYELDRNATLLKRTEVEGFALYSLGLYPAVIPSPLDKVVVEVFKFKGDWECYIADEIIAMELGAGYKCKYVDIMVRNKPRKCKIFVYRRRPTGEKIQHGDWVKYFNENLDDLWIEE